MFLSSSFDKYCTLKRYRGTLFHVLTTSPKHQTGYYRVGCDFLIHLGEKRKTKTKRKKEKKKISHSSIKGIVSSLTFNQRAFHKTPRRATYSSGVRAHLAYPRLICFQLTTVVKNGYGHPEGHKTLKNDINIYSTNASFNMI